MIHGDRSQSQRTGALSGFEEGKFQVLVATDVASRGIHVNNVAHVINYDLPQIPEDFIHRVGRTGRMGSAGRASTLVSGAEIGELRSIERALKLKIVRKQFNANGRIAGPAISEHLADAHPLAHEGRSVLVTGQIEYAGIMELISPFSRWLPLPSLPNRKTAQPSAPTHPRSPSSQREFS